MASAFRVAAAIVAAPVRARASLAISASWTPVNMSVQASACAQALRPVAAVAMGPASGPVCMVRFDSTHRKRGRMMNKHKLRKLRKKMRNIGGENQKKK